MIHTKTQNTLPNMLERFIDNELDVLLGKKRVNSVTIPNVNIIESNEIFKVDVAVPGFEKKDFTIELKNNLLKISSENKEDKDLKKGEKFNKKEFNYQSFSRTFTLPKLVDGDKITATYENGILSIAIPKKEEAKPKPVKQIIVA